MDTKTYALPGLLATLVVGLVLLLSGVRPGSAERPTPTLALAVADTQHIHLHPGWNYISGRLVPYQSEMDVVLEDVQATVPLLSSADGAMFYPAGNLMTAGTWEATQGYRVYAETAETLVLEGDQVPTQTTFTLSEGWNLIPYILDTPLPPEDALSSIAEVLLIAKDADGQAYIPSEDLSTMSHLMPGRAYLVFVEEAASLTYPNGDGRLFAYHETCDGSSSFFYVEDFGSIHSGPKNVEVASDSLQMLENYYTFNTAIAGAGEQMNSTLCLPEGRFDFFNPNIFSSSSIDRTHLVIDASHLTIQGAGRNDDGSGTGLFTNGKWYEPDPGAIHRGTGIRWNLGNENLTLRGFELNGQGALPGDSTAWTGCKGWQSRESAINCWHTDHKGLNVGQGGGTMNTGLLVEDVAIRSYKGELIYQGGRNLGTAVFRRIISEDTNAQGFNVHGVDVLVEDSYFGLSNQWYEIESLWGEGDLNMSGVHRNNTFDKCTGAQCISIAQGDNTTVPFTFENNYFTGCDYFNDNSGAVMGMAEATGGPLYFRNNTLVGCYPALPIVGGGEFSGPIANVFIEDNTVTELSGSFIRFWRGLENWQVRGNYFEGSASATRRRIVRYGGGATRNSIVENNTFVNETAAMEEGSGPGEIPLWRNNTYTHGGPGSSGWLVQWDADLLEEGFKPLYEYLNSGHNASFAAAPFFNTAIHPDSFRVSIGLAHDWRDPLQFTPDGHPSYSVTENVMLGWGERAVFEFDADNETWVFVEKTTDD